jgi:Reverse transcriptase (RNA-dependent DNA polymerase)
MASPTHSTYSLLKEKHPVADQSDHDVPCPGPFKSLVVGEDDIRAAVRGFPAGSAGGPDGLRPRHLQDLLQNRESGPDLITQLTAFTNMVLAGGCPATVAPVFFGGRLIALNKKDGGIRPIVVGLTLRRLASRCANTMGTSRLATYFNPIQLGVGTSGGCEAAVHAARRYLSNMPEGHVLVKLDFKNAFNCLERPRMLSAVADRLPELYPYCYASYHKPSILFYGSYRILSQMGPQQGDPIGPLLFSNTIQPMLEDVHSDLRLAYLDDVTLGGPEEVVSKDVDYIVAEGGKMGLRLNESKCELLAQDHFIPKVGRFGTFTRIRLPDATLLGAPLFRGAAQDDAWSQRCKDLANAVRNMKSIRSQDALILLRAAFGTPKVLHLLRCTPSVGHPALANFDEQLRLAVQQITNTQLSDLQWQQASLPIWGGGLGVRRVTSLALPAYLASAHGTASLQDRILGQSGVSVDGSVQEYLEAWTKSTGGTPPTSSGRQSAWDVPLLRLEVARVERALEEPGQRAAFMAARAQHSGDWLAALPIAACGLVLEDEAVRVAVGIRLGLDICAPHKCRCGVQVDAGGRHSFVCKRAPGRAARHHVLNDAIARAFATAGVPVSKEPAGLSRSDGKRPDGMTLIPWLSGRAALWDVTVICTTADSYMATAASEAGAVAELAAARKRSKYQDLTAQYDFYPLAFESHGAMCTDSMELLGELGRRMSIKTGENRETAYLFQRISVIIQRFNAVLLYDSFNIEDHPD